jgi:hypothetical protein
MNTLKTVLDKKRKSLIILCDSDFPLLLAGKINGCEVLCAQEKETLILDRALLLFLIMFTLQPCSDSNSTVNLSPGLE